MTQPSLLDLQPSFDSGVELTREDHIQLGAQLRRVLRVLSDGAWWTVPQIHREIWRVYGIHDPEPSISAQIRNAKKLKHGSHDIRRLNTGNRTYKFRLVQP